MSVENSGNPIPNTVYIMQTKDFVKGASGWIDPAQPREQEFLLDADGRCLVGCAVFIEGVSGEQDIIIAAANRVNNRERQRCDVGNPGFPGPKLRCFY